MSETGGERATLGGELRALMAELCGAASAEIAYQKTRASLAGKALARLLVCGVLALALGFFTLLALVEGLLLALLAPLGPWGATAAMVGGLAVTTALAVLIARAGWRRLWRLLSKGI